MIRATQKMKKRWKKCETKAAYQAAVNIVATIKHNFTLEPQNIHEHYLPTQTYMLVPKLAASVL